MNESTKITRDAGYYESLNKAVIEQIKDIDTSDIPTNVESGVPSSRVIEKQRTFIWIRVYLKEELTDIEVGDLYTITYDDELLDCQFIAFGKSNILRDNDNNIINYDTDDDLKQLCMMVDQDSLTSDIPFIRSLFRSTPYFQYQVYKRKDLVFNNTRTSENCDYIDVEF